jgi:hypothetical protein
MKICGKCVCAIFSPVHCCLAYMPKDDKRRGMFIDRNTECFVPEQFHENESARLERIALRVPE